MSRQNNRRFQNPRKSVDEVAREVIDGKWGTDDSRTKALKAHGYDPVAVQKRVVSILSKCVPSNKKSTTAIAREVVNNKWGDGKDRKNRLESAGYDYAAVQRRIEELY